jgi:RNA polymerase sigma-70 factor, ECF subfamily
LSQQPAATGRSGAADISTTLGGNQRRSDLAERFCRNALPLADQLHSRARRLTDRTIDAEDLVQETLLRAFARFESYREGTNVRAWLFTVMYHTWIDNHRAAQCRPAEHLTHRMSELDAACGGVNRVTAVWCSAEMEVLDAIPNGQVFNALRRLPVPAQTVVYLADVHGFPHKEIARLMSTSAATVTSRLYRGRQKLRELLTATERECHAPVRRRAVGDAGGA